MKDFEPADPSLFFKKNDPRDPRLGEIAQPLNWERLDGGAFVLGGYPDDEGIRLNGGRPGAGEAPDRIRKFLYKMTPSLSAASDVRLQDAGNLGRSDALAERHERGRQMVGNVLQKGAYWIGLGGGHDYGYSDGAGFLDFFLRSDARPMVINFDAHLDVRPTDKGFNSGTPFYRLLNDFEGFDFFEIGVQAHCNSQSHFDWCESKGGRILGFEEILYSGQSLPTAVTRFLGDHLLKPRPCYLSIDIDGFSSAYAMGCSQSWATGFEPTGFFQLFEILLQRLDVRVLGLYEVSPPLDSDDRTSKLAAQIVHRFLYSQD